MSLTEKSEIRSEDKPKLKEVINSIEDDPQSYEFREPVDWKGKSIHICPIKYTFHIKDISI